MFRPALIAAMLAAASLPHIALAQGAAPQTPNQTQAPAQAAQPRGESAPDMLADIYVTRAVLDYCKLDFSQEIVSLMNADAARLEAQMSIRAEQAKKGYDEIAAVVSQGNPDCTSQDGNLMQTVAKVTGRYQNMRAAPPENQGETTAPAPAAQ